MSEGIPTVRLVEAWMTAAGCAAGLMRRRSLSSRSAALITDRAPRSVRSSKTGLEMVAFPRTATARAASALPCWRSSRSNAAMASSCSGVLVDSRWSRWPLAAPASRYCQGSNGWVSSMTSRGSGASTVIRAYGVLASILDDAVKDRLILTNPARGVSLPRKVRKEHAYLTHQQVHALAEASGKYSTLVLLLAYSGLRWGEATGLRVKDLDLLRRRLSVSQNAVTLGRVTHVGTPKSHHRRTVPVPAFLVDDLARQCEGKEREDRVFRAPMGGYMQQPNGTRGWFDKAWQEAELPRLTPHDLRHTAASLAVSAGANVKAVQRMLGHASAAMNAGRLRGPVQR